MVEVIIQPSPSSTQTIPMPPAISTKLDTLSSTPGGCHYLSSTPGGTRIWYTRDELLALESQSPGRYKPNTTFPQPPPPPGKVSTQLTNQNSLPSNNTSQTLLLSLAPKPDSTTLSHDNHKTSPLGVPTVPGSNIQVRNGVSSVNPSPSLENDHQKDLAFVYPQPTNGENSTSQTVKLGVPIVQGLNTEMRHAALNESSSTQASLPVILQPDHDSQHHQSEQDQFTMEL